MRLILPSLSVLIALSCAGLHCAYADSPPAHTSSDATVLDRAPPAPAGPRIELVDDGTQVLPTFWQGGRRFVLGQMGARYQVRIVNPTAARIEAVVSVDGLDAIDGRPANLNKRGYIVPAFGDVTIEGFRTSLDAVAAFRFSSVRDSYAARVGRPRNVGVVGVAFFGERPAPAWHYRAAPPETGRAEPAPPPPTAADAESSAPSKAAGGAAPAPAAARPGLGTQFGESRDSHVVETTFVRASTSPMGISELRYDDREGLLSRGIQLSPPRDPRAAENERRDDAQSFPQSRFALPPP